MTKAHINGKNRLIFLLTLVIGIMVLIVASKYAFQRACSRREIHWPDLEIADEWQYKIITEAYKIKNEPNREITITASDGVKLVGHYFERKKNALIIIFFHGLWSDSYVCGVPIYRITEEHKWNLLLVSLRAHGESGGNISTLGVLERYDCCDWANWVASEFGEQVPIYLMGFSMGGADVLMSSDLNINNNAGSTHIEGLQKFVVEKGLDIGFAYDGDADRCLCVDEKGNVITGDHILYIYGCYMKERGKLLTNTVVTTVMSNFGLYKAFDEKGIGYAKTAVGDKYVYEYMAKNGCRIGGEQSGHIIFSKYASTGDGILTSLKMMEVMLAKKMPMSKLAEPLKIYPQVLENVRVTDKKAAQDDEAVQAAVKAVAEALGDTGRILVRESGTEPVVRVMVEAPDHDTCQKYVSQVVETIKSRGYGV